MKRARVGVLLAGCGVYDGAEIQEAVITLLALDRASVETICMAPNVDQLHVVNHLTGEAVAGERRNVLVESARIARGAVRDIASVGDGDLDALILPGGFGAAKNLCDFAVRGPECSVHPEVERLLREVHRAGKPIGAICIAPALIARVLGAERPALTIGNDEGTAGAIEMMGGEHRNCPVGGTIIDRAHGIVSTPAYMLGPSIKDVAEGIERLVADVLALVRQPATR